jgi:amidase
MGRSAADLAILLSVMSGYDRHAPLSLDERGRRFEDGLHEAPGRPRIAWLGDLGGRLPFEPGILDLCFDALAGLAPDGWTVEPLTMPFDWAALWRAFVALRQFSMLGRYGPVHADPAKRALLKPAMRWEIESGLALDAKSLAEAAATRGAWYEALLPLFDRFDAVALPSAQVFPFPIELDWPRTIAEREMDTYHRWMEVVVPGTMSGCPVAAVPAGFDERGRPMGIQLIGRPRGDAALLALAARYGRDASGGSARRSD